MQQSVVLFGIYLIGWLVFSLLFHLIADGNIFFFIYLFFFYYFFFLFAGLPANASWTNCDPDCGLQRRSCRTSPPNSATGRPNSTKSPKKRFETSCVLFFLHNTGNIMSRANVHINLKASIGRTIFWVSLWSMAFWNVATAFIDPTFYVILF